MTEADEKLIEECKRIIRQGKNAEVKKDKDDHWIIYAVDKTKIMVG